MGRPAIGVHVFFHLLQKEESPLSATEYFLFGSAVFYTYWTVTSHSVAVTLGLV